MKYTIMLGLLLISCGVEKRPPPKQAPTEDICIQTPFSNKQIEEQCLEQQRIRAINERTKSEFGNRNIK